jgi:hypothetical protein
MTCPNCGSDQWKSASLVHKEGSSTSNSTTVGIGLSSGASVGIGLGSTSGTVQSEASRMAAPPATFVKTGLCIFAAVITAIFALFANWWWWYAIAFVVGAVISYRSETKEDDIASANYKRKRMCTPFI